MPRYSKSFEDISKEVEKENSVVPSDPGHANTVKDPGHSHDIGDSGYSHETIEDKILRLEAELAASKSLEEISRGKLAKIKASAQSQAMFGPANTEVEVDEDKYAYRIDLPPSGGMFIRINGEPLYHSSTYTFNLNTLRTVKDIVARSWAHETTIQGNNENAYRKPKNVRIGGIR